MSGGRKDVDAFIRRVHPHIRFFYRACYALTASRAGAERVLMDALTRAYIKKAASTPTGLRDAVLYHIRAVTFEYLEGAEPDDDWQGLGLSEDAAEPGLRPFFNESRPAQRLMVLRYGCGLTVREMARITPHDEDEVKTLLRAARARMAAALKQTGEGQGAPDRVLVRTIRRGMNQEGADKIDEDYILSALSDEIMARRRPRRAAAMALKIVAFILLGLVCALLLWLVGVLTLT